MVGQIEPMDGVVAGPRILKFASCLVPEAIDAMRYDWDRRLERFSFYLDPQIPYVVGAHAELVVDRLLQGTGLYRSDIRHWLVHSGGKKVIDAVMVNLGLSRYDLRHTSGVLRDHGNVSSGSFLFSFSRLQEENVARPGDFGVMMTMGPGSTLRPPWCAGDYEKTEIEMTMLSEADATGLRLQIDGANPPGPEVIQAVQAVCDQAEESGGRPIVVEVSGTLIRDG